VSLSVLAQESVPEGERYRGFSDLHFSSVGQISNLEVDWEVGRGAIKGNVSESVHFVAQVHGRVSKLLRIHHIVASRLEVGYAAEGISRVIGQANVKETGVFLGHELVHVVARGSHHQELRPVEDGFVD